MTSAQLANIKKMMVKAYQDSTFNEELVKFFNDNLPAKNVKFNNGGFLDLVIVRGKYSSEDSIMDVFTSFLYFAVSNSKLINIIKNCDDFNAYDEFMKLVEDGEIMAAVSRTISILSMGGDESVHSYRVMLYN